jgi:hypothetical protein
MAKEKETREQGCQMVYFLTKNPNLGKFLESRAMEDVGIFCDHLVYFVVIWNILW